MEEGAWCLLHACFHGHKHTQVHVSHMFTCLQTCIRTYTEKLCSFSVPHFVSDPPSVASLVFLLYHWDCMFLRPLLSQANWDIGCDQFSSPPLRSRAGPEQWDSSHGVATKPRVVSAEEVLGLHEHLSQWLSSGSKTDSCHRSVGQWSNEEPDRWPNSLAMPNWCLYHSVYAVTEAPSVCLKQCCSGTPTGLMTQQCSPVGDMWYTCVCIMWSCVLAYECSVRPHITRTPTFPMPYKPLPGDGRLMETEKVKWEASQVSMCFLQNPCAARGVCKSCLLSAWGFSPSFGYWREVRRLHLRAGKKPFQEGLACFCLSWKTWHHLLWHLWRV